MAIPIEGYTVVAQKARVEHLLESGAIDIPNATPLGDDDLWRCSFMAETDAREFLRSLEKLELNVSQGPDSDAVLVNEWECAIQPYCEWLITARWDKGVIAWLAGTTPDRVVAPEGWDPKIGSGLQFHKAGENGDLEFLRLEGNVEVYRDKATGKEVYVGRTSAPVEALFKTAAQVIDQHLVTAGEPPVAGKDAEAVAEAAAMLEEVIENAPDSWTALWYHGKAQMAIGNHRSAYQSFRRAYALEKGVEIIARELAGACLELGKFTEAVEVAERAAALEPANAAVLGNVAVAYLMAGRLDAAQKAIAASEKINPSDAINQNIRRIALEVMEGKRPQPTSLASLAGETPRPKKRLWEFWN